VKLAEDWIAINCSEFIGKDEWPPNSPDVNPLDYHIWGVMLKCYKTFCLKPKNTDGLKSLAINMKQAATGLDQQGHTEIQKNTLCLCESEMNIYSGLQEELLNSV